MRYITDVKLIYHHYKFPGLYRKSFLTDSTEEFNTKSGEYVEEQEKEKSKVANFWQSLYHSIQQRANRHSHFEQLQNCK